MICLLSLCWAATAPAKTLTLAVASNFKPAMEALSERFTATTGHTVSLAFGSSGKIYAQIRHGAPFDLFFSADQAKPLALEDAGLTVPGSRYTYAVGALALWSATRQDSDILTRLKQGDFRKLALANPRLAPYGKAATQVLDSLNLTALTRSKWVVGENIAQTYQFVNTGNAELGFVALSQIMLQGEVTAGAAWRVPPELYRPIQQDAVMLKQAAGNTVAHDFMLFMHSDTAQQLIRSFGYTTPD